MFGPRRYLPSIPSLLALEAVDRLGTATAAAEELALTHSAVSRQIKVLEGQIGVRLVVRDGSGLKLTRTAQEYCEKIRAVLTDLSRSTLTLRVNPAGGSLNLAILPAFGLHWLAPKLKSFAQEHPEVTVNLSTRLTRFDFDAEQQDAALHYGTRDWHGVHYLRLAGERVLPVCAPGLFARPLRSAEALQAATLLHLQTRPGAWENWFRQHDLSAGGVAGMLFDQFSTMAQAAVHGMGVALLPEYLAQIEIARGRLVSAFGDPTPTEGQYFLVWPQRDPEKPQVEKFVNWLKRNL
ncbi:LysR family transcriptional regulator [Rhodophyticola sp. CCM32]|uniref:LysR substrate-binding domain-containing protein n=1 Tax=Rhodophyticola sp. CCM32 TaxID=2916397 RepID=UPI00107FA668|nr:LysR substrate-binding domain-containing protein [Rhodophyticola sp. CCM32]QBY00525.1 LysR family transcriptional regulator [Rhodophyticola sp. CCM32]